ALHLLAPRARDFSIFSDDFVAAPAAAISMLDWAMLAIHAVFIALAVAISRRLPLAAFGLLFFYLMHAFESTVFPLEPYFEHRNYLPSAGLVLAAGQAMILFRRNTRRVAAILTAVWLASA